MFSRLAEIRWTPVLLTLASIAALFVLLWTGRGGKEAADGRTVLTLAVPANYQSLKLYQELVDDFMRRNPDVLVKLHNIPGKYYQKLLVMIAGGVSPDVMWMGQSFSEFADRDVFLDVSSLFERDFKRGDFNPEVLSWYSRNGKVYGIPFGVDVGFIAYNKRLFDEAGLAYPSNDWTFDEFLAIARKLTKIDSLTGKVERYGLKGSLPYCLFGTDFVGADGKGATCASKEMIDYLNVNLALFNKYRITPSPEESKMDGLDQYSYFAQGRAAMMYFYSFHLPYMTERFKDMDWDIVLNPLVKTRVHWASSQGMAIARSSKHPDKAWLLCREFLSKDFLLKLSTSIPASRDIAAEAAKLHGSKPFNYGTLVKASETPSPTPRVPHLQELQQLFQDACDKVWASVETPDQAMADAQREINRRIESFKSYGGDVQ